LVTARLSVQLYSLREVAGAGLAPVIDRLAAIGYAGVEVAGFHDLTPGALGRHIAAAGLQVSAGHVSLPDPGQAGKVLDDQQALGSRSVVVAYLPPETFATEADVAVAADRLKTFAGQAAARGLSLGYHNHWWEFATSFGGRTAHQYLFERVDPAVFAEVDTYWAKVGGADPAAVVRELGERAPMLHIKDGSADDPRSPMTAVGEGVMDVPGIVAASAAEWLVVELDRCATDMFEAIEKSHHYLTARGLARGAHTGGTP
jgi:sugar phosphate isomerase/epimerase